MALNKWKYGIPKKEEPKQTKKMDKTEVFNKTFAPTLPFVPTVPTERRLDFNQPKSIESDLPKTTKVTAPITGRTFGLDNVKTYQAPIGQSKKELDIKDKSEKKEAKETAETLQKELTEKYGFKVKRANSPIEYANILLKVPANQKEQFKKDYDQYILAAERSNPFRAGAEAGFNILPTNLEKTQGKEVVEEAKGFGAGRFVGGAGQQLAFNSVLGTPIEGLVGKVLPKATPLITETIKDVAIGTGTQLAEAPFDKPTAGQFVGNAAMDVALNVLFGAVGKGLSKLDLFNLRSAKPKSVVDDVARELGVSEAEADKVLDDAIDFYVNQYGTASPNQFDQLQLPAPEFKPEFKSDTFASTLRNKTNDIYVNQFGVADTKPFEQLQLEAPKNIASDTSAVRFRDGVQPQYKGADFKGDMSLTERKYPTANLGDRKIKAFQFNNPEVQPFYREKAEELLLDATYAKRGSRKGTLARDEFGEVVNRYGDPRVTTPQMARILDETGSKYEDIQKALQDLIDDNGKENHALAKKIENVIDDMLVEGYVNVVGETIKPNIRYIQLRNRLDTTKIPIPELEGPKASQLNNQLRMGGLDESGQRNVFDADMQRTDFDDFLDYDTRNSPFRTQKDNPITTNLSEKVKATQEPKIENKKVYFRGTDPSYKGDRITTGNDSWDKNLFVSTDEAKAKLYGPQIEQIKLKDNSKVLVEGDKEFNKLFGKPKKNQQMLEYYGNGIANAKAQGYDVVEFKNQSDVGTVIINEDSVIRNYSKSVKPQLDRPSEKVKVAQSETNVVDYIKNKTGLKVEIEKVDVDSPYYMGDEISFSNNDVIVETTIREDATTIELPIIITKKSSDLSQQVNGSGLGTKVVNELKNYADKTGKELKIIGITESGLPYWDKQKWLKTEYQDGNMIKTYKPSTEVKPQLDRPSEFSIGKPQYPPLAKPFAKDVINPVKPTLNTPVKEVTRDFTIQKSTYPKMQLEFTKERPSVLQPGDRPNLKVLSEETTDPVLKKFRLDLFGATPEKPVKATVGGKTVNVVGVKGDVATLSDGTTASVKNISVPKTKIEPALKPKQVDFEKETLSGKTGTVANGVIKERGFSENIRTDKNRVDELRQEFDQDKEFYETLSNKSTLESAQARFDRGYDLALKDFRATSDTIRADNVPLAKLIADEAVRRGDMDTAREVVVKAAESLTKAGQFSQAAKILRETNDPIAVMRFVNSEIKKLNAQGSKRYGKGWEPIKLDENELGLIAKITKDTSDEQKEEVFQQIFDSMVKRIPTTKREKFDAWRRIAMLFNPKTHVRNTLGNGLMRGLKTIADKTAQTMELALPKDVRTKGFATKELKEVSKNYFDANKKKLLEGSRWDIFGVASPFSEKRIFKTQFLESLNEISKKTLEGEDIFFFKSNFINDLAGFMNARGLKEPTEEAVEYALRRSQEATFRQANAVANAINGLKGSRLGLLVDAAIPFTKTPANILQTGIDYSPIGAMKSVVQILNKADPATAIENLSKGLTGTGLALIGAWASYNGLARGAYEKSNKVEGLYQATGMLPNSIKTPGGSYTIDWAQPIAMPFFMGVAFMDELKKGGQSKADAAFKALLQSGESLVNQSMLSGVKDLFGGYGTMTEKIIQLPINYMTQGFPTVGGQIARVIDPLKRQIDYSNIIDSTTTSLQAKTPLLSKELPVKRDILGKPQEYGKGLLNVFQQFLSPGFIGKESDDPVVNEIDRLYKSVGADFLPKSRVTNFTDEKVKYNLTTEEISEVQRIMGEYTNKQLLGLMNSYDYKNASDTERAKMIKKANETGYELAKKTIVEARKK